MSFCQKHGREQDGVTCKECYIDELEKEIERLKALIEAAALIISPCLKCGAQVLCWPDGLALCRKCAAAGVDVCHARSATACAEAGGRAMSERCAKCGVALISQFDRKNGQHRGDEECIEALKAEVERLTKERDDALSSKDHCQQWHAVRLKRLEDWFRNEGKDLTIAMEFWNIVANGTKSVNDPPTYSQQMNMLRHEVERLKKRVQELENEIELKARHDAN